MFKIKEKAAIALTLLCLATAGRSQAQTPVPTVADWRQELSSMVDDISLLHPDPFTKIGRKAFAREVRALEAALPTLTDEERVVRAMRLVALIGDGHTLLEPLDSRFGRWYPVRIQEFADGYHVVTAHQSVAELAGAKVLAIAGRPIEEVAAAARALIGADNHYASREQLMALHNAALMRGLGWTEADGSLNVRFRLRDGASAERSLPWRQADHPRFAEDAATFEWRFRPEVFGLPFGTDDEWVTAFHGLRSTAFETPDTTRPVHLTDRRPFNTRALPARNAFYARMNYVSDTDFVPFVRKMLLEVDRVRPQHFIIDWRQNFGGDGSKLQFMTREFVKRADDPPWGHLYVLTGPKTFSAAIMALEALLRHVPATVVGEPSAAGFNHFGDPVWRTYPLTGVRLNVSTRWWQLTNSDDLLQFVPVHVPAPWSFADLVAGKDPALDPILDGEDMRSIPAIAVTEGGEAAAATWRRREARFGGIPWWAPPAEYELRQACDSLLEKERHSEALATCQLNAELHPHTWNVWYNLAGAQRAAGLLRARLGSYRCVMRLAPDNWNVPAIRRLLAQPGNEGAELPEGCPVER